MAGRLGRRSFLGGVGMAAATTGLAACSSPSAASNNSSLKSKNLTLLFLGGSQQLVSYLNRTALPAFKKSSGYTVQLHSSTFGAGFQKVTTEAASNSLEDVVVIGGIWTAPLAALHALLDITDRVANWSQAKKFYPGMMKDCRWQGKQYAVPFGGDIRSGIYRQDILDAAGVTSLPTTWDEFHAAAVKVKQSGKVKTAPIDWGLGPSGAIGLQQAWAQLYLQAGGTYFSPSGKAEFDSVAGEKSLTFLVDTYKQGLADFHQIDSANGPTSLVSGASAMTFSGAGVALNAAQYDKSVVSKLVAGPPLKVDANGSSRPAAWINKFAISAKTKDPDGAWSLVQYLTSPKVLSQVDDLIQSLPSRQDLSKAAWIGTMGDQILATASNSISQPQNPKMLQVGPDVETLLEKAIRGGASVSATLAAIDKTVDSINVS